MLRQTYRRGRRGSRSRRPVDCAAPTGASAADDPPLPRRDDWPPAKVCCWFCCCEAKPPSMTVALPAEPASSPRAASAARPTASRTCACCDTNSACALLSATRSTTCSGPRSAGLSVSSALCWCAFDRNTTFWLSASVQSGVLMCGASTCAFAAAIAPRPATAAGSSGLRPPPWRRPRGSRWRPGPPRRWLPRARAARPTARSRWPAAPARWLHRRLLVASAPFASASVRSKVGTFGVSGAAVPVDAVAAVAAGADAVVPAAGIAIAPAPPVSLASASCSTSRLVAGAAWVAAVTSWPRDPPAWPWHRLAGHGRLCAAAAAAAASAGSALSVRACSCACTGSRRERGGVGVSGGVRGRIVGRVVVRWRTASCRRPASTKPVASTRPARRHSTHRDAWRRFASASARTARRSSRSRHRRRRWTNPRRGRP